MESKSSVDDPFSHLDPRNVPLQFHAQQTHVTTNPTNPTNPTNLSNPTTTNAVDGPNFTNSVNETLGFRGTHGDSTEVIGILDAIHETNRMLIRYHS